MIEPQKLDIMFDKYCEDREPIEIRGTGKYALSVPTIMGFWQWLRKQTLDEYWTNISYSTFKRALENRTDEAVYIYGLIEDNILTNGMIGNYNYAFAHIFGKTQFNWNTSENKIETPQIIGIEQNVIDITENELVSDEESSLSRWDSHYEPTIEESDEVEDIVSKIERF